MNRVSRRRKNYCAENSHPPHTCQKFRMGRFLMVFSIGLTLSKQCHSWNTPWFTPPPQNLKWNSPNIFFFSLTWFHENGRISANYGPISKIQNLAYSGLRARSVGRQLRHARRHTPEMTSRGRVTSFWPALQRLSHYATSSMATVTGQRHAIYW